MGTEVYEWSRAELGQRSSILVDIALEEERDLSSEVTLPKHWRMTRLLGLSRTSLSYGPPERTWTVNYFCQGT